MTYAIGKNLPTCSHPSPCVQPVTTWKTINSIYVGFCTRHEDYREEQHGQPE